MKLCEIISTYISEILPRKRPKTQINQRHQLEFWSKHLGDMNIADIKPLDIIKIRRLIQGSDSTKNIYMAALRHLFTIAIREFGATNENPILKVSNLKNPRGRVRYLSDEERKNLLIATEESSNRYLHLVVLLALTTGARKMEIMNLTWSDIDIDKKMIYFRETKNGEVRTLPIVHKVGEFLLEHFKNSKTSLIFPSARNLKRPIDIRSPFAQALKCAGIVNFHFHDLRHSCASYLVMNGASLNEIAEVLGHKSLNMVKRYAHLSTSHISKVVNSMANKIFNLNDEKNF